MDKLKMYMKQISWDKSLIMMSMLYVVVPIIIFFFGWIKLPIALALSAVFVFFIYKVYNAIADNDYNLIRKDTYRYWFYIGVIVAVWVYLSGIGSLVWQNGDFWVRNPIYRDLSTYSWPVFFDLSKEPDMVQAITGTDNVAFSYYYVWWLPAAAISKLFHLGEMARNMVLFAWAFLGIMLIIYLLNRMLGKCSYIVPIVLIFFGGLDSIPFFIKNFKLPFVEHMEWWAEYFQYSSNTTQLFFVFNQSIPVWLIVALLLQLKDNKYVAGLSSLVFAYSPWAVFGMVPIAIAGTLKKGEKIKKAINVVNILVPLMLLIVFGLFFMASSGSEGYIGLIFGYYSKQGRRLLFTYLYFIFVEAVIYFLAMGQRAEGYRYYWVTLFELILFPLFIVVDPNFIMRGSIPALFLLTVFIIKYFVEDWKNNSEKIRKVVLVVVFCIGLLTPLTEINRTVQSTFAGEKFLREEVVSFGNMQNQNEDQITTAKEQFFIYDYENSLFFKYLGKHAKK